MAIECLVLGAGQEVGKSCVVVSIGGKKIMFDCGMHMGSVDDPYPDFSRILRGSDRRDFDSELSCVVITHFHLDHVGALPYFTQVCGYNGPIYMTYPTKALSPLMLEDYRKVMVDRRGEQEKFTNEDILESMKKVTAVDIKQTIQVDKDLQIRAYYAGHVLGAAMFYAKVGESTLVYTGDYNMTPDRHLGAAQIDRLQLDLVITESTYATTIRDSKYAREREFLKVVHKCVSDGGKVLIPTFAMGRAQELCILLNDYWDRMKLKVPIYFSAGLTLQANMYYKMLIGWTSQKIKDSHTKHNAFDFKHVQPFTRSQIDAPGPCILFATPGMLTGGFSLEVFKHWAPSEKNLITLPGYCLAGTVGHKLMSGKATRIDLDKDTHVDVRCQIHQLSFSPHTDSKGIMDLVRYLSPKHVILVHGEKPNMEKLKVKIQSILGMPCYIPANNESVLVPTTQMVKIDASKMFIENASSPDFRTIYRSAGDLSNSDLKDIARSKLKCLRDVKMAEGILVMEKAKRPKVIYEDEIFHTLNVEEHKLQFSHCFTIGVNNLKKAISLQLGHEPDECVGNFLSSTSADLKQFADDINSSLSSSSWLHLLQLKLKHLTGQKTMQVAEDHLVLDSAKISICQNENCPHLSMIRADALKQSIYFSCSWSLGDEHLAHKILSIIDKLDDDMIHDEAGGCSSRELDQEKSQ